MNRAFVLLAALALAACSPPVRPYGQEDYEPAAISVWESEPLPAAPSGADLLVLGALEDETVQPGGGLYNTSGSSISPLLRTHFAWALGPKLRDELQTAFRSAGVPTFQNSLDLGQPPARGALVLRGSIVAFTFDQLLGPHQGWVVRGTVELRAVSVATGRVVWRSRCGTGFRIPPDRVSEVDPFAAFARDLVSELLQDPAFRAVLIGEAA